nr:oligosaccharide flippase family protein [Fredinandcohnia onubensis]
MYKIRNFFKTSLFKSSFIYTLTNVINAAIPFLMMPVLTRYLNPSDYGILAMFGILLSLVTPFTGLSTTGAIARQYYDKDRIDIPIYVTNSLFILISSSTIVGIIFYFLAEPISNISSFPVQWMWAIIIVSATGFVHQIILTLWQISVKPVSYSIFQVSRTVVNVGLSIWFVVGLGLAWQGQIQAQIIVSILFSLISVLILLKNRWLKFKFNKSYIKSALSFGVPLLPHSLSGTMKTIVDRFFITNLVGLTDTGIYSVGFQIGSIISILGGSFNQAFVPWLYERLERDSYNDKVKIVKFTYIYFIAIITMALGVGIIASWFFPVFLGPKFIGASTYVIWISLGFAFAGMYMMVVNYIFFVKKTYILAWVTFSVALVSIIVNYFLIKSIGTIGAAYTFAGMNIVQFLLVWLLSNRVYPMPWNVFNKKTT